MAFTGIAIGDRLKCAGIGRDGAKQFPQLYLPAIRRPDPRPQVLDS